MTGNVCSTALTHERGGTAPTAAIREILAPSDLSVASDRALDHARLLAERFHAHLVLYHALAQDGALPPGSVEQEVRRRLERAAREHLERRTAIASMAIDVCVEAGAPVPALLAHVRDRRPDLVVMSTHGRQGVARLVLGSVTEKVLESGLCPTLCVREPEHGVALPYRRLLVPTDLSPASRRAFPMAAALAGAFGAEVVAVHAASVHAGHSTWGITTSVDDALPSEGALLDFLQPELAHVRTRCRAELGCAWDCITRVATEERVDLIVMSTHGLDSLADRFLGSHAERVVRQAPCPVLIV